MSIINRDAVKGAVVTTGTGVVLKKARGFLRNALGLNKNTDNGGLAPPQVIGKRTTKNFTFPLDVEGGPGTGNQGHYVMFFINEQIDAKIRFGQRTGSDADVKRAERDANIPKYLVRDVGVTRVKSSNKSGGQSQLNQNQFEMNRGGKVYQSMPSNQGGANTYVARKPTIRLDTAIALYMPPQAIYRTAATYHDTEIGIAAKSGADIFAKVQEEGLSFGGVVDELKKLGPEIVDSMGLMGLAAADNIPGFKGARAVFEMGAGEVIANRMELAFKKLEKRNFQFNFKMIPKSREEADEIRKIVYAFRANMAPEMVGTFGRTFRVPNTFDIQYMYNGQENQYLHKISTCFLENFTVTYGGDRYRTFEPNDEGAPPVETNIQANFREIELITRERIAEGY
mgnify:CR=1 FL=1|tara:strand:- start:683 stop:1873 length:1191 start_codon:yes stop_codon:yes gene_type:complete